VKIHLIGTGDAFGSGGHFNSCLRLTTAAGADILVDCGASSMVALNRAGIDRNAIRAILVTHFHGDHFLGLPFFVLDAQFVTKRTTPLLIAGPRGVEERMRVVMEAAFPGSSGVKRDFEIRFLEVTPDTPATIDGVAITAFPVVHDERAGPCQGYRLAADGKVFALSGDTGWTDSLIPLADGADVLLIECYERARQLPAHLDWETIKARLDTLRAKRILLTHRGPSMLALTEALPVERAEDGMVIAP
jgi:ribonuclease BN (tRNA processing enzyme)